MGEMAQDEMAVGAVQHAIEKQKGKYYLIEGFPLSINQAVMFENLVGEASMVLNFTAEREVLVKNLVQEKQGETEESVMHTLEEYEAVSEPVLSYYSQFAKVRHVDCAGTLPEVYQRAVSALLPKVYFVIGPRCAGKSTISNYLAERANMKHISFAAFASDKKFAKIRQDPSSITQELIKLINSEASTQIIVDGFPESQKQLDSYLANSMSPELVLYLNATEDICLKNNETLGCAHKLYSSPPLLLQSLREFNKGAKGVLETAKKLNLLFELRPEEGTLRKVVDLAGEIIRPEIILGRCHEKGQELLDAFITELVNDGGYMHLDVPTLRKEEIARHTLIGNEMMQYVAKGKILPAECTIKMLRRIIYSGSGCNKFVLTGFPEEVEQLKLFEDTCAKVTWEFYLYPEPESALSNFSAASIEAYMHSSHKLTVTPSFTFGAIEKYYGEHLQYVFIHGPKVSGKTTIAKAIAEKFGFTLLDTASLTEELKKKLATEEIPAESVNVTFEQILGFLHERMQNRQNRKERFVLDIFPLESMEQVAAILDAVGPPTHYLELEFPIDYLKGRYKIVNTLQDLAEDQVAELEKGYAFYESVKQDLAQLKEDKEILYHEIKASLTLDKVLQGIQSVFEPKIIPLKCDVTEQVDTILTNLSIKYGYLYLNATALIKQHVTEGTKLGKELRQRKKPKELLAEYRADPDAQYCAAHYDFPLIIKMIKEGVEKFRTNQQYIVVTGLINSHKLKEKEDQLDSRSMDELFAINKELGTINAIVNLTKEEYDTTEDVRKAEMLPPKPVEKVEVKKVENEEEVKEEVPEEEGIDKITNKNRKGKEGRV